MLASTVFLYVNTSVTPLIIFAHPDYLCTFLEVCALFAMSIYVILASVYVLEVRINIIIISLDELRTLQSADVGCLFRV